MAVVRQEWRSVVGHGAGRYEVSSLGNVRSLNYNRGGQTRLLKPATSGGNIEDGGYLQVALFVNGVRRARHVAHLVAEAFHGPRPDGLTAEHRDRDRTNNHKDNLMWATREAQNRNQKMKKNNTSGLRGVCKDRRRWRALLGSGGKQRHVGSFATKRQAAAAYIGALRTLGEPADVAAADEAQAELDEHEVREAVEALVAAVVAQAGGE